MNFIFRPEFIEFFDLDTTSSDASPASNGKTNNDDANK